MCFSATASISVTFERSTSFQFITPGLTGRRASLNNPFEKFLARSRR